MYSPIQCGEGDGGRKTFTKPVKAKKFKVSTGDQHFLLTVYKKYKSSADEALPTDPTQAILNFEGALDLSGLVADEKLRCVHYAITLDLKQ